LLNSPKLYTTYMLTFYKYHGAGNDFIIIDNRLNVFDQTDTKRIQLLCRRRFGIGADGIILLEHLDAYDFSMVYINSDGSVGSMCGNGGRCIVHFAHHILNIVQNHRKVVFEACDGLHEAEIHGDEVKLKMQNVGEISERNGHMFLRSGTTPHNVVFVENIADFPVVDEGKRFQTIEEDPKGMNINFVEQKGDVFHVRTYERGVWDETMACGTGATSVAIACASLGKLQSNICNIKMPGGDLKIEFEKTPEGVYQNIWLTGPAKFVFKGEF
jgi:diaminopimelate epimerase